MSQGDIASLVAVLLLIAFGAFMAVAETALTRTSRARAQALLDQERPGAIHLFTVVTNYERYLNSVYLVVLAAQTAQAAITGVIMSRFGVWGVVGGTVVNVVFVFVVAEVAPKTWALQHTDRAALSTARMVVVLGRIFRHVADLLISVTNVILPGKGLRQGPFVTEEEIIALAGQAAEGGGIDESERDLIESIIDFGDTVAREIMVPRTDMVTFEHDYAISDCIEIAILNGLSRFPVFRENIDDIVGIVYSKELMVAGRDGKGGEPVSELMRDAYFVPETKRVAELLSEMQANKSHIAIVVDEYGGTAGLATLEDLIEELVGEIEDEFDPEELPVTRDAEGDLWVDDPAINVDDLNADHDLSLPEGEWDSVGGLVFSQLGRVPEEGDEVDVDGYRLVVDAMDGRRVSRVKIVTLAPDPIDEESSPT